MAEIFPFRPYRYTAKAGDLDVLVTQPYDKISPSMQARYLASNPYNLVRVILGESFATDSDSDNVYTRAGHYFRAWIAEGVLEQEPADSLFAYFQEFTVPDTGEQLTRKGFIGLGAVVDYEAGIVHRHEQTLSGPKKDRRRVLEATGAHFGQIFMLYPDPECRVDAILDQVADGHPAASVTDEYGTIHRIYRIDSPALIGEIQSLMSDKKLLIADGHHRYETALAYKKDNPDLPGAARVMMTFVNMHSPGLRILATHRVVHSLPSLDKAAFLEKAREKFTVLKLDSTGALLQTWEQMSANSIRIGVVFAESDSVYLLKRPRDGALDVRVLHDEVLDGCLGISAEAVREERYIRYVRGAETAVDIVKAGQAQAAFLLEATTIQQVAETSFGGGVMPQKSTDFYPKLLTGMTIYKLA